MAGSSEWTGSLRGSLRWVGSKAHLGVLRTLGPRGGLVVLHPYAPMFNRSAKLDRTDRHLRNATIRPNIITCVRRVDEPSHALCPAAVSRRRSGPGFRRRAVHARLPVTARMSDAAQAISAPGPSSTRVSVIRPGRPRRSAANPLRVDGATTAKRSSRCIGRFMVVVHPNPGSKRPAVRESGAGSGASPTTWSGGSRRGAPPEH